MKLCICFMLGFCLFVNEVTSACNETMECTTAEGKLGVCFDGVCLTTIPSITKEHLGFIIKVQYPQNKLKENSGKNFHIRGNGLGFNWKRGKLMSKMSGDTWSINITYKSSDEGFQCQGCSDETIITRKLEYRIFIDDKIDMVGGSFAVSLPVSMTSTYFDGKPIYEVYPWFNLRIGTISNFTVHSPEIGSDRLIALYLPPSYDENIYKKYPKFFIFDVMPNTLQIFKNSLDNLLGQSGTTKEFILIGFGSYLPGGRTNLLTPSPGYFLNCINGTLLDNCDHCIPSNLTYYDANFTRILRDKCGKPVRIDGDGDKVLDFLLKTVLPKADEITQNRMLPGQKYTGIMGYSLGGLMACHAAWTRHAEFGMAGCQSPSLWWPLNNATFLECEFDFINITLKDENLKRNRYMQNILLDAGSAETTNPYRLTQSTVEAALEISRLTNFELNQNVWANIYPNATHSGTEWAYRFWTPLKTLLPSDGASRIPADVIDNSICDVSGTVNHSPTKLLRFLILQLVFVIHLI